jgi:hypothetical protein
MNSLAFAIISLLSLMANSLHAQENSYHVSNVAYTQQSQTFSYSEGDVNLNLQGYGLLYQYGIGDWRISVDYDSASDDNASNASQGNPQYELQYETSGMNVFAEYNWPQSWLAVGVGQRQDDTRYHYREAANNTRNRSTTRNDTQVDYTSLTLDSGYIHALAQGQWIVSGNLIQQYVEEQSHYIYNTGENQPNSTTPPNPDNQDEVTLLDENGTLASMGLSYGHYVNLSETWQLYLSAGIRRQITITGNTRTTTRFRNPQRNNQASNSELESISQSASTTHQLQISAYHNKGSISFNVNNLNGQSISKAYFSVGVGINF